MDEYFYSGFYARFDTVSKSEGSLLMGPDNIVGDDFSVVLKNHDGINKAWLVNKFNKEVGFLDVDASRKVQLALAKDQVIRAILSFVAYTDNPDPGCYWGQVAVFCYNPSYRQEFDRFIDNCASKISDGVRPNIDFGQQSVKNILSDSSWLPKETVPFPKKETGFAILKDHRSISEKVIEQGRSKNIGCYVVSWAFIILLVLLFAYFLHSIGLF